MKTDSHFFDDLHRAIQKRLLQESPEAIAFQFFVSEQLKWMISDSTRDTLQGSLPAFAPTEILGIAALVVRYHGTATICHASHWDQLDDLAVQLKRLTGITQITILGSDTGCRIWFDPKKGWIREELGVAQ
jgi:hypothetical protein